MSKSNIRFGWQVMDSDSCLKVKYIIEAKKIVFTFGTEVLYLTADEWDELVAHVEEIFEANE